MTSGSLPPNVSLAAMNVRHDPLKWYARAFERASQAPWIVRPSGEREWLYKWDCPECGTSKPKARLGHGTLFLRWDGKQSSVVDPITKDPVPAELHAVKLAGPDADVWCESPYDEAWHGPLLVANAMSVRGLAVLRSIAGKSPGFASLVEHVETSTKVNLEKHLEIKSTTGMNKAEDDRRGSDLSTIFNLYKRGVEVARCHVSYRDGSHSSTIGPSIEFIEANTRHRGKRHLRELYSHVEKHFLRVWKLRVPVEKADQLVGNDGIYEEGALVTVYGLVKKPSLNGKKAVVLWPEGSRIAVELLDDGTKILCKPGNITRCIVGGGTVPAVPMIMKATYLFGMPVERRKKKGTRLGNEITDKTFLTECGFEVRDLKAGIENPMLVHFADMRIVPDQEMIKFVNADEEVPTKRIDTAQTNFCENCRHRELSPPAWPAGPFQRCGKCKYVWYCSEECQAEDWPFHRLWCKKELTLIEKKMERLGLRVKREIGDGYFHVGAGSAEVQLHAEQCTAVYDAVGLDASDPRRKRKVEVPDSRSHYGGVTYNYK